MAISFAMFGHTGDWVAENNIGLWPAEATITDQSENLSPIRESSLGFMHEEHLESA